ncbi:hypothetical protein [Photobacterium carnosum]|uniref:Uncharacterized protein n=1 Tax=Photobacterium carnosum TaxID=2023717 RepID=A0A2N4ULW4_9GAMM|nr:hypothetical protein [Photobacterium carnosum]PLC56000.1 hypothetical protein CIK00_20795 [Photobacterium carnosum]
MTNEEKMILAIDKIYITKTIYEQLSDWEKSFLRGLSSEYRRRKSLSVKQKNILYPILKKHNVI